MAKRLEQFCKKEIYDIEMCVDCFERSNTEKEWFTQVCDPPHLLVWARESSRSPFKPAKVIGVGGKLSKKIDVRFFGNHDMADVSPTDCYLYSKVNPNTRADEKTMLALMKSLEVSWYFLKNTEIQIDILFLPLCTNSLEKIGFSLLLLSKPFFFFVKFT